MSTLALNLRLVLSLEINQVAEATGLDIELLRSVEFGRVLVPERLVDFYAFKLRINSRLLHVLFRPPSDRFSAFRVAQSWVVRLLNSYIGIALRMAAFDEENKKISS
jgi:hypothetical protein